MAHRTLLGMETEYAVSATSRSGAPVDRYRLVELLLECARRAYPHLRDSGGGLFLENGARLYVDRGAHPELATPECADPRDAIRCLRDGEALLLDLADRARRAEPSIAEIAVFRHNVDYGRSGASWGCHESYLHRCNPVELPAQLVPHFVTRIIYTGAGGFNPLGPGVQFTLSPRAWMLGRVSSADSTAQRGIFHQKDERLAGAGWHRLHAICGESLCSDTAALLKLGSTALILATIEMGARPGDPIRLASPVQALHALTGDPDGIAALELAGGARVSAREIQRHYLAVVEDFRARRLLPTWAEPVCRLWRATLDGFDTGAEARTLDWAIKRALFQRVAAEGMAWNELPRWTDTMTRLELTATRLLRQEESRDAETILLPRPRADLLTRLEPAAREAGVNWDEFRAFLHTRNRLLEADLRFGQLGERGIFSQLDTRGVLAHRCGIPERQGALPGAAPAGRARLRGDCVRTLWAGGRGGLFRCDWTRVWEESSGRRLDLSDPFAATAEWGHDSVETPF
jgi:proteasome accessory factor A